MGASVQIQMAAASNVTLKEMGVMVNGQAAEKINFTQQAGVTRTVQAIAFHMPDNGEGIYNLSVQTTAWDGTVTVGPANTVTLDGEDPQGAIFTEVILPADAYGAESGLMRFSGIAGDSLGRNNVATVQLSVNGGPFVDVTYYPNNGEWSTLASVGANPYGKSYAVTMRIIDKAGRTMTATKQVAVAILPPPGFNAAAIPSRVVNDVTVNESAGTASFVISLSAIQTFGSVAVHYSTANGSAQSGDYSTRQRCGRLQRRPNQQRCSQCADSQRRDR